MSLRALGFCLVEHSDPQKLEILVVALTVTPAQGRRLCVAPGAAQLTRLQVAAPVYYITNFMANCVSNARKATGTQDTATPKIFSGA